MIGLVTWIGCAPSPTPRASPWLAGIDEPGLRTAPALPLTRTYTLVGPPDSDYGRALARGDVNGDALQDLAVGAPGAGRIDVYYGVPRTFDGAAPDWTDQGEPGLGAALALCDVESDGFVDLVAGDPARDRVLVYPGWPTGPQEPIELLDPDPGADAPSFGAAVACGDVDDNEIADVIVGDPGAAAGAGRVYVHFGGQAGVSPTAGWSTEGLAGAGWGATVAYLGDTNGDEYGEVAIGAGADGAAAVFYGTIEVPPADPGLLVELSGPDDPVAEVVAAAGDVDGDSYQDLLVGGPAAGEDHGAARLYLGGPKGLAADPAWTVAGAAAGERLGAALVGVPDLDVDGFAEIVVLAPGASVGAAEEGAARVYRGAGAGAEAEPAAVVLGGAAGAALSAVATAGDLDWDGRVELALSAVGLQEVWLYAAALEVEPPTDTGVPADSGADTGAPPDPVDTGTPPTPSEPKDPGCGCGGSRAIGGWSAALVALLFAVRRPGRKHPPGSDR